MIIVSHRFTVVFLLLIFFIVTDIHDYASRKDGILINL